MAGEVGLCPGWSQHKSKKNGEVYYYNSRTGASTYSRAEVRVCVGKQFSVESSVSLCFCPLAPRMVMK